MQENDTIAAIATPLGSGGISIVRMSGNEAERILSEIFKPAHPCSRLKSRYLTYGHVYDNGEMIDECLAVIMRKPGSYTCEDVCELQLHGGGYTCNRVMEICIAHGARLAEPGEFTKRAFLNGRIDLSQAEAVMGVISSQGEKAHRAAIKQLEGGTLDFVRKISDELYSLQSGIAACIDYPEEIDESEAVGEITPKIKALAEKLEASCDEKRARILTSGLDVVLCGKPNVGKSSLLNTLLQEDRAIVTSVPGTTRDLVTGDITLGGGIVHLTDTAGIRETNDEVESIGVVKAEKLIQNADLVIFLVDGSMPLDNEDTLIAGKLPSGRTIAVINKTDKPQVISEDDVIEMVGNIPVFSISSIPGSAEGVNHIKEYMLEQIRSIDDMHLTAPRHLSLAEEAAHHLRNAIESCEHYSIDIVSVDLQSAQKCLAEITGDNADEKLLDHVFSEFCVGK